MNPISLNDFDGFDLYCNSSGSLLWIVTKDGRRVSAWTGEGGSHNDAVTLKQKAELTHEFLNCIISSRLAASFSDVALAEIDNIIRRDQYELQFTALKLENFIFFS